MTDDPHPFPFQQCFDDLGADADAADLLYLATGDGLPVSNQGQGFHQRPGIAARLLVPETGNPGRTLGAHLDAPTRADFLDLDATTQVII